MKHWLFTILSAFSLVLAIAGVFQIIFGGRTFREWSWKSINDRGGYAEHQLGAVGFNGNRVWIRTMHLTIFSREKMDLFTLHHPAGFRYATGNQFLGLPANGIVEKPVADATSAGGESSLAVPVWFLALLLAVLPAFWWRWHRRRSSRVADGMCKACGYDMRATPDLCPECGTVPKV